MSAELERFYELLDLLSTCAGQGRLLADCTGKTKWASRGVYFFFEPTETRRQAPDKLRVVRVGTHAVSAGSKSTLWGRLRAHRGARDGRGHHRGSIFRLHVGAALLAANEAELSTWGVGSTAPRAIRDSETAHEQAVSRYLGRMQLLWLDVPDESGPRSARSLIERNAIALLSNQRRPIDAPSEDWLGRHSARPQIAQSGLWNLNYVDDACNVAFLDVLERHVRAQVTAHAAI